MDLYQDLGVSKNAPKAEIKKAYRKKAMKLHPDRKGGDPEKFHSIQRAYDVLGDDARRAHYDATGEEGKADTQGALIQRLAALFMHFVETADVDHADIVVLMREALRDGKNKTLQALQQQHKKIERYERTKKRLKKNGDGENLLAQLIDGQISIVQRGIELGKSEIGVVEELIKMVDGYSYAADAGSQYATFQGIAGIDFAPCRWQR